MSLLIMLGGWGIAAPPPPHLYATLLEHSASATLEAGSGTTATLAEAGPGLTIGES